MTPREAVALMGAILVVIVVALMVGAATKPRLRSKDRGEVRPDPRFGTAQTIGIEPGPDFEAPTMALDALEAEES